MLKPRQKLGKYVVERRLGQGGFAVVYQARDTIEGTRVALKIPYAHLVTSEAMNNFRHEVRLAARLDHPHVLPLKNADYIGDLFVIVTALGEMTLDDRLQKRMSTATAIDFARQMLSGVAYAHEQRIIHCDIKPDNFVIFNRQHLRLTDFGIARVAQHTLQGSGTGTVGYIAPEQALGKPSFRSDVFSLGLMLYRMFAGILPEWPYEWPPPNYAYLQRRLDERLVRLIQRAIQVDARKRYRDAAEMQAAFLRVRQPAKTNSRSQAAGTRRRSQAGSHWKAVRRREFVQEFGRLLDTRLDCETCGGPVSEAMTCCPWCGKARTVLKQETSFPAYCPRCHRGIKLDWKACAWCFGDSFQPLSGRTYTDKRYQARCSNPHCERKELMPFMRYCPWCRRRVRKKWKIEGSSACCPRCRWGVLPSYWTHCPWCAKALPNHGG